MVQLKTKAVMIKREMVAKRATALSANVKSALTGERMAFWSKAVLLNALFLVLSLGAHAAGDVGQEIQDLFDNQIKPIIKVVTTIAIIVVAVYAGFQFWQGKREGYKTLIMIIVGALIIRFLPDLILEIIGN